MLKEFKIADSKKYAYITEAYNNIIKKLNKAGGDIYTAYSETNHWMASNITITNFFISDGLRKIKTSIEIYEIGNRVISHAEACDIIEKRKKPLEEKPIRFSPWLSSISMAFKAIKTVDGYVAIIRYLANKGVSYRAIDKLHYKVNEKLGIDSFLYSWDIDKVPYGEGTYTEEYRLVVPKTKKLVEDDNTWYSTMSYPNGYMNDPETDITALIARRIEEYD